TLLELKRGDEALAQPRQAIRHQRELLEQAPQDPRYRQPLCRDYLPLTRLCRQLGRHSEAVEAAREYQKLSPRDAEEIYQVACEVALCVPLVGKGKKEPTAEERALQRRY